MHHARQALGTRLQRQCVVTGVIDIHHVAAIALQQAQRYLLRAAGGVVESHNLPIGRPTGLHPHPGLAGRIAIRFFRDLHSPFVAVDHRAFLQPIAHQVQQRLEMLAAARFPAH